MFITDSFVGVPIIAWLISVGMIITFIVMQVIAKSRSKSKEASLNDRDSISDQAPEAQLENKKSWFKPTGNYLLGSLPVILIVLIAFAILTDNIYIGIPYSNVWLILALIGGLSFIYLSKTCEKIVAQTTWVIFGLLLVGLIYVATLVPSLMGTPEATLMKPVDISSGKPFEYKVNHPHWTGYYLEIPDNTWLEITAKGKHNFRGNSTLFMNDGVKSCGPEGATFKVAYLKNDELDRTKPHLPHPDNFPIPSGHYASLIGKVDEDGEVFEIGKYRKIFIEDGGLLYISSNLRFVGPDWRLIWEKVSSGTIYFSIKMSPNI